MCLIVAISPEAPAAAIARARTRIENAWQANSDGAGFALADGRGAVLVKKGYFKRKKLLRALELALQEAQGNGSALLLHLRMATHGRRNHDNSHPHRVSSDPARVAMAHNGILSGYGGAVHSDTVEFARKHLSDVAPDVLYHPEFLGAVESAIGGMNKLAFVDARGRLAFANEGAGNWDEGVWYSCPAGHYDEPPARRATLGALRRFYGRFDGWDGLGWDVAAIEEDEAREQDAIEQRAALWARAAAGARD